MREEMYALDLFIKKHANDKKLKFISKRVESKLAIYRIGFIKKLKHIIF